MPSQSHSLVSTIAPIEILNAAGNDVRKFLDWKTLAEFGYEFQGISLIENRVITHSALDYTIFIK